jgi:hypothetical protein
LYEPTPSIHAVSFVEKKKKKKKKRALFSGCGSKCMRIHRERG